MNKFNVVVSVFAVFLFSCTSDDAREPILGEDDFSSELFFSEYVEGTSFNKALEIVNLTGATVDLQEEAYSIKKQSNGAGNWLGELFLTGRVAHLNVYVIGNEAADNTSIINNSHQLKTGAPMDFNGNDAIGLFKDGVLIDVIGNFDDPEDFAKDVTLRRNSEVTEPSANYDVNEWEVFEMDNVEDLGRY